MAPNTEHDALIGAYTHLDKLPRAPDALLMLRKIASLVKPIMRKRGWHVGTLAEFIPAQENLLGVNYNRGQRICLRLRCSGDHSLFKDLEEVTDTMLHELSHNVFGPHDSKFHALWEELRGEYEELVRKGYSGDGFLSDGNRLGGRATPIQQMRQQARLQAERRRALQAGSGRKLGGAPVMNGIDIRAVIAAAAEKRLRATRIITQGCGSGNKEGDQAAEAAANNGFRTKADEDDANDRAISQALWELMQNEEDRKAGVEPELWIQRAPPKDSNWRPETGIQGSSPHGSSKPSSSKTTPPISTDTKPIHPTWYKNRDWNVLKPRASAPLVSATERQIRKGAHQQVDLTSSDTEDDTPYTPPSYASSPPQASASTWACNVCTLVNPDNLSACDACETKRPPSASTMKNKSSKQIPLKRPLGVPLPTEPARPKPFGWNCHRCGSYMESQWWTCSMCGVMKTSS